MPMLLRPDEIAAKEVLPVPTNGSNITSPAKENRRMRRSANSAGYGAGCPFLVDSPLMSVHDVLSQAFSSSLDSIERAFCKEDGDRYEPPLRKNNTYSKSFFT